ncbi:hypothetical protein EIP91_004407 [Steccherinum ochraceum]|uniref:Alpha/beta hydrolase fold-3 domain-containing protein n=1 Tax=Steccherinum ochraceum TaxID=92696 RepID=A0A4R0RR18_9APHY|nr:hypothetical protein EIP91_004407 [Steccherinum ochraceum]
MADSPYAHFGAPDPEFAAIFQDVDFPWDDVPATRKIMNEVVVPMRRQEQKANPPDPSTYVTKDHSVPVDGGAASILVRTVTPTSEGPFPVYYYIHGGGFIIGTIDMLEYHLTTISVELGIVVAMLTNHTTSLNIDLAKGFVIGGDSAGANMSTVAAHLFRDDPSFQGKQPTGQILEIPGLIDPRGYPEELKAELRSMDMVENVNMAGMTKKSVVDIYSGYLRNSPTDPTASPLLFPSHANLPPALVLVSGLDLFRDEGIVYERLLREAGNQSKLIVYPGISHGAHIHYPQLKASRKWRADFVDGLRSFMPGAKQSRANA